MWLGLGRTGVYSAGNGPAMRAPVLGVLCDDLDELRQLVKISTELTHTDPKAYRSALAVALLAWYETRHPSWTTEAITAAILQQLGDNEFSGVVCGRGRNPTLRLWPAIFSGEIDVFPSERRNMGQEIGR